MAKLALVDPLAHILGPVIDEWSVNSVDCTLYQSGALLVIPEPARMCEPWTKEDHERANEITRTRHPELTNWHAICPVAHLPHSTFTEARLPTMSPEQKRGSLSLVIGSKLGAVCANYLMGLARKDCRTRCFTDIEEAARWALVQINDDTQATL